MGPQPTLSGQNPNNQASVNVTIDFGDSNRAILASEIGNAAKVEITGGTAGAKVSQNAPADTIWLITINRTNGTSNVTLNVKPGWYQDAAMNYNTGISSTFVYDAVGPAPSLTGPASNNQASVDVTIDFGDSNRAILASEIGNTAKVEIIGGTAGAKVSQNAPADTIWLVTINRTNGTSNVTVNVKQGWYQDAATNNNTGISSTFVYDAVGPAPSLTGPASNNQASVDVTIDFGDSNRAILASEIGNAAKVEITGGTGSAKISQNSPADTVWLVTINRTSGTSDVTVAVKPGWYQDAATNNNTGTSSTFAYDAVGPVPSLAGPASTNQASVDVTIDFGDSNRSILASEIGNAAKVEITGGTAGAKVSQNAPADTVWLVTINRSGGNSDITIEVKPGWYQDAAGNWNLVSIIFSSVFGIPTGIESSPPRIISVRKNLHLED
jgi:dihydrodipicolinate reductase